MRILLILWALVPFPSFGGQAVVHAANGKTLGYRIQENDPIIGVWDGIATSHHARDGHQQGVLRAYITQSGSWCAKGYYRYGDGPMLYVSEQFCGDIYVVSKNKYRIAYRGYHGADLVLAFLSPTADEFETVALAGPGMENMIEADRFYRVDTRQQNTDILGTILNEWVITNE